MNIRNLLNILQIEQIKWLLPVFIIGLLTACEDIIAFKGKEKEEKLVMNMIIGVKENNHTMYIAQTRFLFPDYEDDYDPYSSGSWEDPDNNPAAYDLPVALRINNEKQEIEYINNYMYTFSAANLKGGDKIDLQIDTDGIWETITAHETIPEPPLILSVDTMRFFDPGTYSLYMRTLITLKDTPGEKNCYRLLIRRKLKFDQGTEWEQEIEEKDYYINQDLALSNLAGQNLQEEDENRFRIFPDDLFQGEEYTINVYFPLAYSSTHIKGDIDVEIELQALTPSLYYYMRSVEQSRNSDVFTNPVMIYSNVKGGYGILGIYNSSFYKFKVPTAGHF